ncbi:MAG: hydroxyacid dehydrogenase [Acidimicrobiales bacterium]|nr:hydroxyacid dehydrogenase [Acidimicrobiales bacterium]
MSREHPKIVLAHWDGMELVRPADIERINTVGTLLNSEPIAAWADAPDELLAEADVVLGHWGCPPLDAALLDRMPNLALFTYAAGTVKGCVSDELWARDIRVTSGSDANAEPVAEFTLAAILFANKDVFWRRDQQRDLSAADDEVAATAPVGNYDKTIGLVSASLVGRRVIELLHPFPRLPITLYDPFVSDAEATALGVRKVELDELCATCDILSIHAPLLPETVGMIGSEQLSALRDGATVINTARGPIIDHDALTAELESGRLRAVLDVTDPEPLPVDHPLRRLPNVYLTPHLAGSQGTEITRMIEWATDEIGRWSAGEPARNEVTRERLDRMA